MSKITILHVSDLHWSEKSSSSISIVTTAMMEDVRRLRAEKLLSPDILVFSGDLVLAGEDKDSFEKAYETFIFPLAKAAGVPRSRIFVCPGNHDVSRAQVRSISMIETGLSDRLCSAEAINAFMGSTDDPTVEDNLAIERSANFYKAHDAYFGHATYSDRFLRVFKCETNGRRIGVACFHSAWRATGEADDLDHKKLIIGEICVDNALRELADCEVRVAVHHHPLDWLLPADQSATEARIKHGFDLTCIGHLHKAKPSYLRDPAGASVLSQSGSVYAGRKWFNGYQAIEIDVLDWSFEFHIREYHDSRRMFDAATTVCDGGTLRIESADQKRYSENNQVELFLREYRTQLRKVAKEHFDFGNMPINCEDGMEEYFVAPPLTRRQYDTVSEDENTLAIPPDVLLDDLVASNENLIFLGDRQAGKTALAFHVALRLASGHGSKPTIPVYIDAKSFELSYQGIRRAVASFYGPMPSGFQLEKAVEQGLFTFLIDNFSIYDGIYLNAFSQHADKYTSCRWLCFGTPDRDSVSRDRLFNEHLPEFGKIHIKELPRKSIRALSKRWCGDNQQEEKALFESVMRQIVRDGLPRTPYMVSLLLWAIKQKRSLERINEATLLSNVIDHLLGKADFKQAVRGTLNPIGKEITLQNLALFLSDSGGSATENDVVGFLVGFFKRKRLSFLGSDVLDKLVACGILRRQYEEVSFKYPCFQEFFVASYLKTNSEALREKFEDLEFLRFRREIELLAGLRQQNDDIILALQTVLDERVPDRFRNCDIHKFDQFSAQELRAGTTRARLNEIRRTRLTDEQVDEMLDEADRRALERGDKPVRDVLEQADGDVMEAAKVHEEHSIEADRESPTSPLRPATHMATIDLLARVIRNSDFSDYEKKGPATKRVFESWVRIFMLVQDEIAHMLASVGEKTGEPLSNDEVEAIRYLLGKMLFNAAGTAVIQQIASPTIIDTLITIIDETEISKGEFLLILFLFEELNEADWQERWSEVVLDKSTSGFVLETFIDRMWALANTKALDDNQSKRLLKVVDTVEQRLDWRNEKKSSVLQGIRDATNLRRLKDS